MGADKSTAQEGQSNAGSGREGEQGSRAREEFVSQSKTCPECGEPVHDVRKTCPNCGYEYKEEDYDNKDAGDEFVAGSHIDEHGDEIFEEGVGGEEGQPEGGNVPPRSQRERDASSDEGPEADSADDSSDSSSDEEG